MATGNGSDGDYVLVTCYGKTRRWKRGEAVRFYTNSMMVCDGAESLRYARIVECLKSGRLVVSGDVTEDAL